MDNSFIIALLLIIISKIIYSTLSIIEINANYSKANATDNQLKTSNNSSSITVLQISILFILNIRNC